MHGALSLDGQIGEMPSQSSQGISQIINPDPHARFPRNQEHVLETKAFENSGFPEDFGRTQGLPRNVVAQAETTVVAYVVALVGKVKRSEKPNGVAKALSGELTGQLSHGLKVSLSSARRQQGGKVRQPTTARTTQSPLHLYRACFHDQAGQLTPILLSKKFAESRMPHPDHDSA